MNPQKKYMLKMERVQLVLKPEEKKEIQELAKEKHVSMNKYIINKSLNRTIDN